MSTDRHYYADRHGNCWTNHPDGVQHISTGGISSAIHAGNTDLRRVMVIGVPDDQGSPCIAVEYDPAIGEGPETVREMFKPIVRDNVVKARNAVVSLVQADIDAGVYHRRYRDAALAQYNARYTNTAQED
jgi:hypothetical protein